MAYAEASPDGVDAGGDAPLAPRAINPTRAAPERAKFLNDLDESVLGGGACARAFGGGLPGRTGVDPTRERRASVIAMAGRTLDPAGDAAWLRARATSA
jgi:hypothetical protein